RPHRRSDSETTFPGPGTRFRRSDHVSIPFRVKALELSTTKQDEPTDRRTFHEGLNLLIGDPGSGKSTIVELIRFGLGVQYQRTLVMNKVEWVLVEIVVGRRHLGLKRWARPSRHVTVIDPKTREELATYPVNPGDGEVGIGTALLEWLGIPSHVKVKLGVQSRPVAFEDVWKYMHVRQTEIHHSIARHDTSSGSKALQIGRASCRERGATMITAISSTIV